MGYLIKLPRLSVEFRAVVFSPQSPGCCRLDGRAGCGRSPGATGPGCSSGHVGVGEVRTEEKAFAAAPALSLAAGQLRDEGDK